jgi:hypothetical protein
MSAEATTSRDCAPAMTLAQLVESLETLLMEEPDVPLKGKLKIQQLLEYACFCSRPRTVLAGTAPY